MRVLVIFSLVMLLIISCKPKPVERPAYLIPEEKFIRIIVDYNIAQGVMGTDIYRKRADHFEKYNIIDTLFKSHYTTKSIFDSTMLYYAQDPKKFEAIFDRVIDEYRRRSAEIESKMNEQKNPKKK